MNKIHKTAIIGNECVLGDNIVIGPYCVISGNVKIANNNIIESSVFISGNTEIGEGNRFFPFSSIGSIPQDLKYKGEKSRLVIGNKNTFREHCTVNLGTRATQWKQSSVVRHYLWLVHILLTIALLVIM